jgi:hypothetical protein
MEARSAQVERGDRSDVGMAFYLTVERPAERSENQ